MEARGLAIGCLAACLTLAACADQHQGAGQSAAQSAELPEPATSGAFDGNWVGSGSNARNAFRTRCGNGPVVRLTIQGGSARGEFSFTVRRRTDRRTDREVISLRGAVDEAGRLVMSDFQSEVTAILSESGGAAMFAGE